MLVRSLILAMCGVGLAGCIPDLKPPHISDPVVFAEAPGNFRGDRHDQIAFDRLHGKGAHFASGSFEPSADEAVVREALRVAPPSRRRNDMDVRHAVAMLLRRRPHAAYVALTASMRSPSADERAGAIDLLGQLDARNGVRIGVQDDRLPLWPGAERDAAIAAAGSLLTHDPDPEVRSLAALVFLHEIGPHPVPSPDELVHALERETDAEMKDRILQILPLHGATPAVRLEAADQHASDNVKAWFALSGLIVEENRALLEAAYGRGGKYVRLGILREAQDERETPQWLEGLLLLGLADADVHMRDAAAHLVLSIPDLRPELLRALRATADSSGWAQTVLEKRAPR